MTKIARDGSCDPFDFDEIHRWAPEVSVVLSGLLPENIADQVIEACPEYIEDARDVVLALGSQSEIVDRLSNWIRSKTVRAYHGTRLTDQERFSILRDGLRPLVAQKRANRLRRSLSAHPDWQEVEPKLDQAIALFGEGERGGRRVGQVHLTVSRSGLINGFSHYLEQGAEFDWHVAHHLLGEQGQALISRDGTPYLITAQVPGRAALDACNPFGALSNDLPNLIREILSTWSYRLANPTFRSAQLKLDCGMMFYQAIPPHWIQEITPFNPSDGGTRS